jgi:integrase
VDAVTARAGNGGPRAAFRRLTAEGLERVFVRYGKGHGLPARRSMQAAMRLFLAFAAERGWVGHELFAAVPSLRTYRLSGLPRGLEDEQIGAVLASPWEGECPLRDRAIVFLLATYGARRGQVSALRLVDIDWRERTVEFAAHKAGKAVRHSLTPAAAHAVAEYLRRERPTTDCEHVFVRHRHPHVRLSPVAISALVRARTMRCGLPPRHPHAFRHAFATRLLRCGQPLKVIADLLGHRSLEAVSIYAKVDYAQLLACAVEWPEVTP